MSLSFNEVILYGIATSDPVSTERGGFFNIGVKRFSKVGEVLEIFEVRFLKKSAGRVVTEIHAGSLLLLKGALRIYKRTHHIDLEDFVVTTDLFDRDLGIEIPRIVTKLGRDYF
ncbi:MAG TPA: hypothetical protein PLM80_04815 [Mesotoga sp.]|nr:hypothetical protein [Mesotoga sp.]NLX34815.1 hypothetical protein [Thermotogaceae bacterium]MDD4040798.1 hypothetical protein [Mesotoga sp.]MDD5743479.1 hypothetical protein [Mesotoga sp.]HOI64626.1 hypothetical protein [Mesotoga sp.]